MLEVINPSETVSDWFLQCGIMQCQKHFHSMGTNIIHLLMEISLRLVCVGHYVLFRHLLYHPQQRANRPTDQLNLSQMTSNNVTPDLQNNNHKALLLGNSIFFFTNGFPHTDQSDINIWWFKNRCEAFLYSQVTELSHPHSL